MSYHVLFASKLEREGTQVFHDPEAFEDDAVIISVPEVTELLKDFIKELEPVAIVEKDTPSNARPTKAVKVASKSADLSDDNASSKEKAGKPFGSLRQVAAEAYICKVKALDKSLLERLCSKIAAYVTTALSKISGENFLSSELNTHFAGLREVTELRNYLIRFIENRTNKKMFREGYVYIMKV
ncbi:MULTISPECIES: hypothetical protein [Cyanophyceae]|uniref:hypothetical protein n=1 Tax=Cyanophyceae TaxID=3028117 RepID=UPI0016854F1A|nr:hypothetical protein [Trichocoleus sp. FACHB-40]MBD2001964.1 hypothetical protein [Trichocoleus sp. FACHB-40]